MDFFYEAQATGLGDYFSACLRADVEGLKVSAGVHRVVYRDYHRLLSKVFPCGIFYTVEREGAVVWAVIDCERIPLDTREPERITSSPALQTTAPSTDEWDYQSTLHLDGTMARAGGSSSGGRT